MRWIKALGRGFRDAGALEFVFRLVDSTEASWRGVETEKKVVKEEIYQRFLVFVEVNNLAGPGAVEEFFKLVDSAKIDLPTRIPPHVAQVANFGYIPNWTSERQIIADIATGWVARVTKNAWVVATSCVARHYEMLSGDGPWYLAFPKDYRKYDSSPTDWFNVVCNNRFTNLPRYDFAEQVQRVRLNKAYDDWGKRARAYDAFKAVNQQSTDAYLLTQEMLIKWENLKSKTKFIKDAKESWRKVESKTA